MSVCVCVWRAAPTWEFSYEAEYAANFDPKVSLSSLEPFKQSVTVVPPRHHLLVKARVEPVLRVHDILAAHVFTELVRHSSESFSSAATHTTSDGLETTVERLNSSYIN